MYITHEELIATVKHLLRFRQEVPWYRFIKRYQMFIMAETLIGVGEWMEAQGKAQRNCGCATHTNHFTN